MTVRQRKLFGSIGLIVGLTLYIMVMSALIPRLTAGMVWLELLFYAVAGIVWVIPVRSLILWMNRPDPE